jgi:hypothetical protein
MRTLLAALAVAVLLAVVLIVVSSSPSSPRLCGKQARPVAGGAFVVQNDEWNSTARECIAYSAEDASFSVASTSISMPSDGAPGGYPSLSDGCFYLSSCTDRSGLPRMVASLTQGTVTSDWSTTQPAGGRYDVAYDIWFDTTRQDSGGPDGLEMMIWLGHHGGAQPLGSPQGTVSVDGQPYLIWYGTGSEDSVPTVSYEAVRPVSQVSGLDIAAFIQNSVDYGYLQPYWYLINVQAGFELWQGGQGLATNAFSVHVR